MTRTVMVRNGASEQAMMQQAEEQPKMTPEERSQKVFENKLKRENKEDLLKQLDATEQGAKTMKKLVKKRKATNADFSTAQRWIEQCLVDDVLPWSPLQNRDKIQLAAYDVGADYTFERSRSSHVLGSITIRSKNILVEIIEQVDRDFEVKWTSAGQAAEQKCCYTVQSSTLNVIRQSIVFGIIAMLPKKRNNNNYMSAGCSTSQSEPTNAKVPKLRLILNMNKRTAKNETRTSVQNGDESDEEEEYVLE